MKFNALIRVLATVILATFVLCHNSWAENYPTRTVQVVVPYGAGSPDTVARIITAQLNAQTGKSFIAENRPGASGEIGAAIVAQSPPDGDTLLLTTDALSLLPSTTKNMPFDIQKDLIPITLIGKTQGSFLVVNNNLPVHSLQEFIAYARDHNNRLTYGSSGVGSAAHLRMAVLAKDMNFPVLHIPFRGLGGAMTALLGGEVQSMFVIAPTALPLIKAGKIRAIAYDNPTRSKFLPNVPTLGESGAPPDGISSSWDGLFAPVNTPAPVVTWLATQISQAVNNPATRQKLENLGVTPVASTPQQFKQTFAAYITAMHNAAVAADAIPH